MDHVIIVEPVIAQVIHQQFISWKIPRIGRMAEQLLHGKKQYRFADLVAMCPVLKMPYRTYCKYDFQIRIKI